MTDLVAAAFRALGDAPSWQETALVADALRNSGDPEVEALLGPGDDDSWNRLVAIADEAGAYGLVALDLKTLFQNPDAYADLMAPVSHFDPDDDD